MALKVNLIRHAEAECNLPEWDNVICGRSGNSGLTPQGVSQAEILGERIFKEHGDKDGLIVYSSTSIRARETALIAFGNAGVPHVIELRDDIREKSHGEAEGKSRYEVFADDVEADAFFANPENRLPGGESDNDVIRRATKFLEKVFLMHDESDELFCVTHSGVIRNLLRGCGLEVPNVIEHVSITALSLDDNGLWVPEMTPVLSEK